MWWRPYNCLGQMLSASSWKWGAIIVHHWMLPRPQRNLDNRECCCSTQIAPTGFGAADGGGPQRQPRTSKGRLEGRVDSVVTDSGRIGRHSGPLTPATAPMMPRREDVEHGTSGEVCAVLDELHSMYIPSSLQHNLDHYTVLGCFRSGPMREDNK